jgi:hypothetical protein
MRFVKERTAILLELIALKIRMLLFEISRAIASAVFAQTLHAGALSLPCSFAKSRLFVSAPAKLSTLV